MKLRFKSRAALVAISTLGSIPSTYAASRYWDISTGSGLTAGNGTWGTNSFWATTSSPGTTAPGAYTAGSDVFFQTGGANTVGIVAGGVSALSITQTTNSTATTLSSGGGAVTVTGAAGIVNSGNSTLTINSGLILGNAATTTYVFNAGSTITVGGGISQNGTATINKTGTSILNLNAANSYSGGTTVGAGRLIVGASGNLGTNVNTNNISVSAGGNLGLTAATNVGASQTLSINSSSTALGGFGVGYTGALPTLNTSGTSTFGGIFGVNYTGTAGVTSMATLATTLNTGGASGQWYLGSQGTGTFNGATLAAASDSIYRLGGGGGSLTFNQANVITGANAVSIGANLTGASGTVVFGAAQNFTGATTVNGSSTLKLGDAGALGDATTHTTGLTVNDAGIFDLGGFSPTYNVPLILNSTASGFDVGAFLNSGTTAVTYGGTVTLQKNTRFGGAGAILLNNTITGGGFNVIKDSTGLLELQNSGTVTLGTFQGNRGTLQVDSGTTLNFTSMSVGTGNSVGAGLTLNGGTVTSSGSVTFGAGSGSASGTLTLNSGTLTVPALTKGSLTFNVNFNGGTLKANAPSTTFFSAATNALVKAGGAFIDDGGNAITIGQGLTHDSALVATSDGGLTKSGAGSLTLSGTNTYTGGTTISEGTLKAGNASALGFGGLQSTVTNGTTVSSGYTLDLNGTTGINEPIILNGTGIGGNGALVNNSGTAAAIGNGIAGATFASGGSGYSAAPTIAISGTGTGAIATASLGVTTDSIVTATGGTGWVTGDTVNVTGGNGSGAIGTVTASGGAITSISITTAGSGYTAAPTGMSKLSSAAGAGTLTLTGNATNFTVSGIAMTAAGSGYTGTPTYTFSGGSATPSALTLSSVTLASDSSIGGTGDINISAVVGESAVGKSLSKVGAGTLTLSGTNTYTGDTTIKAGTLALDSTGSIATSEQIIVGDAGSSGTVLDLTAKSAFTIGSTQTLKGIGTVNIGADKTVTIDGTHAAGNGVGKQVITGNLSYSGASIFAWELGSNVDQTTGTRGTNYDAVDVTGNLAIDGTPSTGAIFKVILGTDFDGGNAFWTADRSWDVFSVGGTSSTAFTNFQLYNASAPTTEITSATYSPYGSFGYSFASGTGTLKWSAVPEPTSAFAGLLITAGLLRRRRSA